MNTLPKVRVRELHPPKPPCKKCGYSEPPPERTWIISHGVDIPEKLMKKNRVPGGLKLDKVMWVSDDELTLKLHTTDLPKDDPRYGEYTFNIPFKAIARYFEGPWTESAKTQKRLPRQKGA